MDFFTVARLAERLLSWILGRMNRTKCCAFSGA
jgi:hypothetical protein